MTTISFAKSIRAELNEGDFLVEGQTEDKKLEEENNWPPLPDK
jgi:hypothetical protein